MTPMVYCDIQSDCWSNANYIYIYILNIECVNLSIYLFSFKCVFVIMNNSVK